MDKEKRQLIRKKIAEEYLQKMKEYEDNGINSFDDMLLPEIHYHARNSSIPYLDNIQEETIRLHYLRKFRCPFCDKIYPLSESSIVQIYPNFYSDYLYGIFLGERKMITPHLDKVNISFNVVYVRKCKKCCHYQQKIYWISALTILFTNILFFILVARNQDFDCWVYQAAFCIFSFLFIPIINKLGGKRLKYDQRKAYIYDAIRTKAEWVLEKGT